MSSLYTRLKITLGKANADSHGLQALHTDQHVVVEEGADIAFAPVGNPAETGIIMYPGGRCDPRAYAPIARALAAQGYQFVIPNMPLRLAVLDANRAGKIMNSQPGIKRWIVGGHSMGGAMAAAYAFKHPDDVAGLFFLASYPSSMHAMPTASLPVAMCYGTHDFITRKSEFDASHERLPGHTRYFKIEGGDHYQFGSFGNVEVTATISRDAQQAQVISALTEFAAGIS